MILKIKQNDKYDPFVDMMDREASEDESAADKPSYFCYKAYIKVFFFFDGNLERVKSTSHSDFLKVYWFWTKKDYSKFQFSFVSASFFHSL